MPSVSSYFLASASPCTGSMHWHQSLDVKRGLVLASRSQVLSAHSSKWFLVADIAIRRKGAFDQWNHHALSTVSPVEWIQVCRAWSQLAVVAVLGTTLGQVQKEICTRNSKSTHAAPAILGYKIFLYRSCFLSPDPVGLSAIFSAGGYMVLPCYSYKSIYSNVGQYSTLETFRSQPICYVCPWLT